MDTFENTEVFDTLVRRIFAVEDITQGTAQQGFITRYRGRLLSEDTTSAYDQLAESLKSYSLTPLFRIEDGKQVILLVSSRPEPKPSRPGLNLIMFLLTVVSVLLSGGLTSLEAPLSKNILQAATQIVQAGWPFAVSLIAILAAHEFGHYFAGRAQAFMLPCPFSSRCPSPRWGPWGRSST